jgi:hypothetical protein
MPTRQELQTLYQKGVGQQNRDPSFRTTAPLVWAESRDSSSAWFFRFDFGVSDGDWTYRGTHSSLRVFGVRSRP